MTASHVDGEPHQHRIVGLEDFDQLADAWDRLARKSGSPIEQYIWAKACAEELSDRYSPYVLAVGPPDQPIAIAPLARRRRPLAPLELLGVHELREPMDFLYANASAAASLAAGSCRAAGLFEVEALPRPLIRPRGRRKCLPQARTRAQSRSRRRAPTSDSTSATRHPSGDSAPGASRTFGGPDEERRGSAA